MEIVGLKSTLGASEVDNLTLSKRVEVANAAKLTIETNLSSSTRTNVSQIASLRTRLDNAENAKVLLADKLEA